MAVGLREKLDGLAPERRARVERRAAELREEEMSLRELRRALTQAAMAAKLAIEQASVARIEWCRDLLLSTLRGHVEAMGGGPEIVARLPGRRPVRLRALADLAGEPEAAGAAPA